MKKFMLLAGAWLALLGCKSLPLDPSIPAAEAGDFTLALSACEAVPGRGMDICRVKEGATIDSTLRVVVPLDGRTFIDGDVTVYYRDISKAYHVTAPLVEIPWKDFFGQVAWSRDMDGEALIVGQIRWKTPQGIEEIWRARGMAVLVVTKAGYDPIPIDSGFGAFSTTCQITYSTAGRSAVSCK